MVYVFDDELEDDVDGPLDDGDDDDDDLAQDGEQGVDLAEDPAEDPAEDSEAPEEPSSDADEGVAPEDSSASLAGAVDPQDDGAEPALSEDEAGRADLEALSDEDELGDDEIEAEAEAPLTRGQRRRDERDRARLIGDLIEPGQRLLVAQGGQGGRGNIHFRSSTNRTPTHAEPGGDGEGFWLRLELKLLADVGIVGFPNVGKSTLISRISRARPKVGAYPFTTLVPQLGVVSLPGERSIVVADVPGLIKGASEGRGLGLEFLRHLERTRVLLHLLAPDPGEGREPLADLEALEGELRAYGSMFDGRPRVVALNKIDTPEGEALVNKLRRRLRARRIPVFPISAATGEGIPALLEAIWRRVALSRDLESKAAAASSAS
jgi:GTP-binding protein